MSLNKICMSALLLSAATFAAPAMAQEAAQPAASQPGMNQAAGNAANGNVAETAQAPGTTAQADAAAGASATPAKAGMTDTASTHDMGMKAASNANVDSMGDTSKKYMRKNRAADFTHEQEVTQQLNQQANAAATPGTPVR